MDTLTTINQLGQLDYDELRDVRDLLEFDLYVEKINNAPNGAEATRLLSERNRIKLRIRGRHSTPDGEGKNWDAIMFPDSVSEIGNMRNDEKAILLATTQTLIDAKQPRAANRTKADGSRLAHGTFQVKTKKDHFIVRNEKGEPEVDKHGNIIKRDAHYLYLRVYTSRAGEKQRLASIYIGSLNRQQPKPFMAAVLEGIAAEEENKPPDKDAITREQLIDTFKEGGYDAVKDWRRSMDNLEK